MRASFCCFSNFSGQHSKVSLAPTTSTRTGIQKVTTRRRSIPEVCAGKGRLGKRHSSDQHSCLQENPCAGWHGYIHDGSVHNKLFIQCEKVPQNQAGKVFGSSEGRISSNQFEPIWLYKLYVRIRWIYVDIFCQSTDNDLLWAGFCLILSGCSALQWFLGLSSRGSGWRRTWTPWCCISLSASFIRCFQPQEAQCLRCKVTTASFRKVIWGETRFIGRWSEIHLGKGWMHPSFGPLGKKQKAHCWTTLKLTRLHSNARQMAGEEYWGI